MNDYDRGRRDADMFSEVRFNGTEWIAELQSTGADALILEPVTERYLAGLNAGGCRLLMPVSMAA